ncbi:SidA/IucD/PvdA family monooxygenase [Nocardiopsis sp. EMB25]|uniref:lysine N(6)-hydroxylase/L-ornithine N(5)-oxygenase family protein n=1 Tax=Nocardiopsis TaxID=2013 RepID=UPI000347438D|nr:MULTISPECIES: SidA/IucD/PvdA family monooxygenase [Nocardiopsis]MCY9786125.1 SidA/IucD/PvdA family monooxygenase [Nocardiopsis sp. EMB25]
MKPESGSRARGNELDVLGVGIGPFNVSLAALLEKAPELKTGFLERKQSFEWHPGLLFDDACLQSPLYKDCVTMVDPTSEYSFLNFLARNHRLHRFVIAEYPTVLRREFNQYLQWICGQLDHLRFGASVDEVTHDGTRFAVRTSNGTQHARDLVLGVGRAPYVPEAARPFLGETLFHGSEYLLRSFPRKGKRVAVIGGGQTGAELVNDLLSDKSQLPAEVIWATRRHNFVPFDESPFANELYTPGYTRFFYREPADERERLLGVQKASSDAILQPLLQNIYRRVYEMDHFEGAPMATRLLVDREFTFLTPTPDGWSVEVQGPHGTEVFLADTVIMATGYTFEVPRFLEPVREHLRLDERGRFQMNEDFSVRTEGLGGGRIFAHNAAVHSHGWTDPNFAAMAWRSAVMTNALAGREVYDLSASGTTVAWEGAERQSPLPVRDREAVALHQ